jgi:glycerate-2-kinase
MPRALRRVLKRGVAVSAAQKRPSRRSRAVRCTNRLIGNNRLALEACRAWLTARGVEAEIVTDRLDGDSEAAAGRMVEALCALRRPRALLFGGETTLAVRGPGLGGRNQHLALKAACLLRGRPGLTLLAAGTDGTDGPTDAAGRWWTVPHTRTRHAAASTRRPRCARSMPTVSSEQQAAMS